MEEITSPATDFATASNEPSEDVVNISDLYVNEEGGTVEQGPVETTEPVTHDDGAEPPEPAIRDQKDFNAALRTRLQEKENTVRRRYESSPEYQLGQQILRERMAKDGITVDEAVARIQNEMISQQAQEYQQNPQRFYEDYLRNQTKPQARQEENKASNIARELIEAKEAGLLPENFDPKRHITPEFMADVQEFGVRAAAKIFSASAANTDALVNEMAARQRVPQPIRTSGSSMRASKPDFSNMSEAQFKAYDERISKALASGKKVRF